MTLTVKITYNFFAAETELAYDVLNLFMNKGFSQDPVFWPLDTIFASFRELKQRKMSCWALEYVLYCGPWHGLPVALIVNAVTVFAPLHTKNKQNSNRF